MKKFDIKHADDFDRFEGETYLERLNTFYNEFTKQYGNEKVTVRPIIQTAFQILGKNTSCLIIDPYMK